MYPWVSSAIELSNVLKQSKPIQVTSSFIIYSSKIKVGFCLKKVLRLIVEHEHPFNRLNAREKCLLYVNLKLTCVHFIMLFNFVCNVFGTYISLHALFKSKCFKEQNNSLA